MNKFEVVMKDGLVEQVETKYLNLLTIHSMLNDHMPFIIIGNAIFNKDSIAFIREITEE